MLVKARWDHYDISDVQYMFSGQKWMSLAQCIEWIKSFCVAGPTQMLDWTKLRCYSSRHPGLLCTKTCHCWYLCVQTTPNPPSCVCPFQPHKLPQRATSEQATFDVWPIIHYTPCNFISNHTGICQTEIVRLLSFYDKFKIV